MPTSSQPYLTHLDSVAPSPVEKSYIAEQPPGLWPENRSSNFGVHRIVFCDCISELLQQLQILYNERFPETATVFLDEWEEMLGLPVSPPTRTTLARQKIISARVKRGGFTRTFRRQIVEDFVLATFGAAATFTPAGIPIGTGISLRSGITGTDPTPYYTIVETIESFLYRVTIDSRIDVDAASLRRELNRITPAGITGKLYTTAADYAQPALTVSGNEITDARRGETPQVVGHSYDGLSNDSSFGVWMSATNLITNSGFETNTTGWVGNNSTLSRVTNQQRFGTASLLVTSSAIGYFDVSDSVTISGATAGRTYIGSAWVRTPTTRNMDIFVRESGGVQPSAQSSTQVSVPANTWVRITHSRTIVQNDRTSIQLLVVPDTGAASAGETFYVDGAQLELSPIPTPVVFTDGATQTRGAARIQLPILGITPSQGWIAIRVRPEFNSTDAPYGASRVGLFSFGAGDANNRLSFGFDTATDTWAARRVSGGTIDDLFSSAQGFGAGAALYTLVFQWTPTQIKMSINGSAFLSAASTHIPTVADTTVDIGSIGGAQQFDGEIKWFAMGLGTLTDVDVTRIGTFGDTDHLPQDFPGSPQMSWFANTSAYFTW